MWYYNTAEAFRHTSGPQKKVVPLALQATIKDHLEESGLPDNAVLWLCDVWRAFQLFDDVADGGEILRPDLDQVIWVTLVGMPSNPFFIQNAGALLPVMALQIQKWQASDWAERNGKADERSYNWRAGYYDIVLTVATLCEPCDAKRCAHYLGLYGETFKEYISEFV